VTRGTGECNMKHVLIAGRFNAKRQGHMGLWSFDFTAGSAIMA